MKQVNSYKLLLVINTNHYKQMCQLLRRSRKAGCDLAQRTTPYNEGQSDLS